MNAILIDPVKQLVEMISISDLNDIIDAIAHDTIEQDPVGDGGDRIYFDENCFVRGTKGRFKMRQHRTARGY